MAGLKLKINVPNGIGAAPSTTTPSTTTPAVATPGGSKPKLTLKYKSNPSTPIPPDIPKPKKTKAGRTAKPSAKLIESKKRFKEETDTDNDEDGATISVQQPSKKIKLSIAGGPKTPAAKTPATPIVLKAKVKGQAPRRDPGVGYDSEASDREIDPVIEEEFILRMQPGDDCDYLRKAIEEKKIGVSKAQGGADVSMKFFDLHCRRGVVMVRKNVYAATLVDLPCIIEGMKSWDRRGWWKSADICQMLLVFAQVQSEEDARTIPLPPDVDETYQYPHGITPPMHYVRKNRFRKRIHKTVIERVEEDVQRLLAKDEEASSTQYEIFDPEAEHRRASQFNESTPGYDDEEDAEGDIEEDQGYFGHQPAGEEEVEVDEDLEADLLDALEAESANAATPDVAGTPSVAPQVEPEEDSGDDSFDDDDGDDDGVDAPNEIDEEEKARLAQIQGTREDIAELENKIRANQESLSSQKNPLLRERLEGFIRKLRQEVQLKKSSIGEEEENE
ncbi:uncharacterized protein LY89DRAFT_689245 [Mollisia scopiformis]|uniref:TAFII55 protein conserved region domain-containing protein n=1 Tax=Mollisia scopiformis TaxID=149040 RepID=A0A194WTX2_MOLSC|nr:uncharacterized protein LY89DRAFT_689245 [Mollisia scopiformis]KUJ11391.1 hypothetical protein LY89DRAFT_689245 [Mollisia scopiformis]